HTKLVEHTQGHQGCDALTIRRDLMHERIAKTLADGAAPNRFMLSQIVFHQDSTVFPRVCSDPRGQRAAVERFTLRIRDSLQRSGMDRTAEGFPRLGRASAWQETFGEPRLISQLIAPQLP